MSRNQVRNPTYNCTLLLLLFCILEVTVGAKHISVWGLFYGFFLCAVLRSVFMSRFYCSRVTAMCVVFVTLEGLMFQHVAYRFTYRGYCVLNSSWVNLYTVIRYLVRYQNSVLPFRTNEIHYMYIH